MLSILIDVLVFVVAMLFISFLWGLLVDLLRIGKDRWEEARRLSGSFGKVLKGEVETDQHGMRDIRVSKGMAWDRNSKKWVPQGKLSTEYIKDMIS